MSFDREANLLADIVENTDAIMSYIADMDLAQIEADQKTIDATERCRMRITEAVIRIGPERMAELAPATPVARVRGLGNVLRHEYDRIDLSRTFAIVVNELPVLRDAIADRASTA